MHVTESSGADAPVGAWPCGDHIHFRVWAPRAGQVAVVIEIGEAPHRVEMSPEAGGFFRADVEMASGVRYRYLIDNENAYPDPASRFQPEGPHGPSEVIDPRSFRWTDASWVGPDLEHLVVYELHIGTFTPAGTWRAAAERLETLRDLGVTVLEVMPVADFPGRFGWGYDGVNFFAPTRLYGRPDDFRHFVDRAHGLEIAVILDVVYNHAGPDGARFDAFSLNYFAAEDTEWGRAFNFDGEHSSAVRQFMTQNAAYWISEFHLDGLRLDATQQIFDRSAVHIISDIVDAARRAAPSRRLWIVGENEPQDTRLMRPVSEGGFGLDALWNDDFHHAARVAATGFREAYYSDYLGSAQEFTATARHGFLFQGQWYTWQRQGRGTLTAGLPPRAFVTFLENHDQVANSIDGSRLHASVPPALMRALTAAWLLSPGVPMLFQGQETGSTSPFLYFADHASPLADGVATGRREFLRQFPSIAEALDGGLTLAQPNDEHTFHRSRPQWDAAQETGPLWALHASLLRIRHEDPLIRAAGGLGVEAAVLGSRAWVLRFRDPAGGARARLLVVNLGMAIDLPIVSEPLLAPPGTGPWQLVWHSEEGRFGGSGGVGLRWTETWHLAETSAWLLA